MGRAELGLARLLYELKNVAWLGLVQAREAAQAGSRAASISLI
jgi:hypothetical protein